MPVSIRAAVCRSFASPLSIETVSLADPIGGAVRVRVKACAICHSDITYAQGDWGGDLPIVFGHEAAGVVEEIGAGVTGISVGDHVVVTLIRSCGGCRYCGREQGFLCEQVFDLDQMTPLHDAKGAPLGHGMRSGAFAEQVVVDQSQLVVIDKDLSFETASLLACGVITGYGAVSNTVRVARGDDVVVIGCGGVGLNALQGARDCGPGRIIAVDVDDEKLATARRFGATETINSKTEDLPARLKELTDGRGADFVFVTVGIGPVIDQAHALVGKAGSVVVVGMPSSDTRTNYEPSTFAAYNQRIIGSKMGSATISRDIPALIEKYRSGTLLLDELVTGTYRLDDINEAIAATKAGRGIRNVIVFD